MRALISRKGANAKKQRQRSGVVCAIGALIFRWRLPRLRSQARQLIVAHETTGGTPADHITGERISSVAPVSGSIGAAK